MLCDRVVRVFGRQFAVRRIRTAASWKIRSNKPSATLFRSSVLSCGETTAKKIMLCGVHRIMKVNPSNHAKTLSPAGIAWGKF
jgi:hypothetical protein